MRIGFQLRVVSLFKALEKALDAASCSPLARAHILVVQGLSRCFLVFGGFPKGQRGILESTVSERVGAFNQIAAGVCLGLASNEPATEEVPRWPAPRVCV